jgi:hypothetical protein
VEEAQTVYVEDSTLLKLAGVSKPLRQLSDAVRIAQDLTRFLAVANVADAYNE